MGTWINITDKVKEKRPVLDREFLDTYINEYSGRTYIVIGKYEDVKFKELLKSKEAYIEYILNNSWESILKEQLHRIVTEEQYHDTPESMFFMDVVSTMIGAEIASKVRLYKKETLSINDGSLHFDMPLKFSLCVGTFYHVNMHIIMESYFRSIMDDTPHPKLFVVINNDGYGGTFRQELDKFTERIYHRIDDVCVSESIQIQRGRWQSDQSRKQGIKMAQLKSVYCEWPKDD